MFPTLSSLPPPRPVCSWPSFQLLGQGFQSLPGGTSACCPPWASCLGCCPAPPRLCWCWLLGPLQEGSLGPPPPSLGRRAACVLRGALQKQHPASWSALLTQEEPWPISVSSVSAWRSAENGAFGGFVSPCPSPVGVFLLRLAERDFPLAAQGSSMSDQGSAGRQNILRSWFE